MILSRIFRFECFCYWLTLTAVLLDGYSYNKVDRHAARVLLKNWRRKAEEQRAKFFDRLPKNVESSYTPVH
jgi:ABC-type transporter MlaC component